SVQYGIHNQRRRRHPRIQLGGPAADHISRRRRNGNAVVAGSRYLSGGDHLFPGVRESGPQAGTLPARGVGPRGEVDAAYAGIKKSKRRKHPMQILRDMEIGVMFWGGGDPAATVREQKAFGVRCGQMGIPGDAGLGNAAEWKQALDAENFTLATVFVAF